MTTMKTRMLPIVMGSPSPKDIFLLRVSVVVAVVVGIH